jgi:hypothetical protein
MVRNGPEFERHETVRGSILGPAVVLHQRDVEPPLVSVDRRHHRESRKAGEEAVRHGPLSQVVADDHPGDQARQYLAAEQRASAAHHRGQRLQGNRRPEANVEHGQDRQGTAEERAGEGAEEGARAGGDGRDQRRHGHRDDHQTAGNALERFLIGTCMGQAARASLTSRCTDEARGVLRVTLALVPCE